MYISTVRNKHIQCWFKCMLQWICTWLKANQYSKLVKHETFLQIAKQNFIFKFLELFWIIVLLLLKRWLLRPRPMWFMCYDFNESGEYNSRAGLFYLFWSNSMSSIVSNYRGCSVWCYQPWVSLKFIQGCQNKDGSFPPGRLQKTLNVAKHYTKITQFS